LSEDVKNPSLRGCCFANRVTENARESWYLFVSSDFRSPKDETNEDKAPSQVCVKGQKCSASTRQDKSKTNVDNDRIALISFRVYDQEISNDGIAHPNHFRMRFQWVIAHIGAAFSEAPIGVRSARSA
jgi:hypothetical protein